MRPPDEALAAAQDRLRRSGRNLPGGLWVALALVLLPFLVLIGLQASQALSRFPQLLHSQAQAMHTIDVIYSAQNLKATLQDAERWQRGYLLAGQAEYLEPYRIAASEIPQLLAQVKRATADDPEQQQRLTDLERAIGVKLREMSATVDAYEHQGLAAAQQIIRTNTGLDAMPSIMRQIDATIGTEMQIRARNLAQRNGNEESSIRIAIVSSVIAFLLMVFGIAMVILAFRNARRLEAAVLEGARQTAEANEHLRNANRALAHARQGAEHARQSADLANVDKSRFLATASHDLRQPLQTLALLNGTLRRLISLPDAVEALALQEQSIGAMTRLLNGLLDIGKIESGAVKPEPADFGIGELYQALRREFAGIAREKGLEFDVDAANHAVHCDRSLLEQILRTLVSNAIKYTRTGGVHLRARDEGTVVRVEVIDTGVGIPADQLPHIYEEFFQVGVRANTTREGYGLGLSIVRRLVKLLDLELAVQSEVGRGSTFSLLLPKPAAAAHPALALPAPPVRALARRRAARILLVEDDPQVRRATHAFLAGEGFSVTAAGSITEALQSAGQIKGLDLIVTDYHLADAETGAQLIASMRELQGARLNAVLITGDTTSAITNLPRDPHLRVASKPLKAEELLRLIRELQADEAGAGGLADADPGGATRALQS